MALNFSHRQHFTKQDCFDFDYGRNTSSDSVDILDVLPSDPFGMDINNTFTAITGWLEDYNQYGREEMFAGFSFIWNNAMRFQASTSRCYHNTNVWEDAAFVSSSSTTTADEIGETSGNVVHPAIGFCLYNLGVKDLLSVSMVCKSLHTSVRDDSLLWKHIHIGQPLNEKITEDALLHLTERAQGTMQCLKLVDCSRITDDCLKKVLERNTQLVKISVPGCTRITIDGILSMLREMKREGKLQVKHLEIGGIFGVTKEHYDELFDLLKLDNDIEKKIIRKQRFYRRGGDSSCVVSCDNDDDRAALDIEMCPRCENSRLVYDCTAEDCKGNNEECRACSLCIQRCFQCGRCINDSEYEETFCLDFLCADCSKPSSPELLPL